MATHILYLHGFNSSPQSEKAEQARTYFEKELPEIHFHAPQIASNPKGAVKQFDQLIENVAQTDEDSHWYFIGSSLGGFFATYLAEKYQRPAVLINPAVTPAQSLEQHLGEQINPYTNEVYQVTVDFIDDLEALEPQSLLKNNYLLMVQTGDEVLDYRQAIKFYQNAKIIKQEGGDHCFIGFEKMLPDIANFLNLA